MSLRSRLILTHVSVILLTLVIIGVSLVYILRDYQRQIQLARLGDAVVPLSFQARAMLLNDVAPREILNRLETEAGGVGHVMLITEKGLVLADAANGLTNRTVRLNRQIPEKDFFWGQHILKVNNTERVLLYVGIAAGKASGQTVYVALSAVERPILSALEDILPSLLVAGGITLFLSLIAALLLARSIAKPLTRLAQATEAVARGQYDHRVSGTGGDEIGRLAASFNAMAERVQRSRQMEKDFVANVSHELKTPLTSIQGFSQAILDGAVQDFSHVRRAAQTIFEETARMARLVGDLLVLARFESGEMPLAMETLDLNQLLPHWIECLQPRAKSQGETLITVMDPLLPIAGDAGRLEQVVINLVENAIKYNRPGGTVTVTAKAPAVESATKSSVLARRRAAQVLGTRWVTIAVTDTGAGIPKEDLPRVFERFYRGDKARVAGGTGLGLSIAHEIVAAHGGKIIVESEIGRGSTFTVQLPVK
ncbi:MAG: HAMP domain-containing protein [Chloroflexi bacterium]|nr:HAMP domain-containing protein [Chloroflexota bacterium]